MLQIESHNLIFACISYEITPRWCSQVCQSWTAFILFIGGLDIFVPLQVTGLWLCHTVLVLWGIQYPFHARRTLEDPKKVRTLHIATLLLTITISLSIVTAASVFGNYITMFHPIGCTLESSTNAYYFRVLPLNISTLAVGTCLTLTIWMLIGNAHVSMNVFSHWLCYYSGLRSKVLTFHLTHCTPGDRCSKRIRCRMFIH